MSLGSVNKMPSPWNVTKQNRFAGLSAARWWSLENVIGSVEAKDVVEPSRVTPCTTTTTTTTTRTPKVPKNISAVCSCESHREPEGDKLATPTAQRRFRPHRVAFMRTRNEKKLSVKKVITKEFVPKSILKKTAYSCGRFTNKREIIAHNDLIEQSKVLQYCYKEQNGSDNEIEEYSSGANDTMSATYVQQSFLSRFGETEANYEPEVQQAFEESYKTVETRTIRPLVVKSLPPGLVRQEAAVDNLNLQFRHYKPVQVPPVYPYKYPVTSYNLYERLLQRQGSSTSITRHY